MKTQRKGITRRDFLGVAGAGAVVLGLASCGSGAVAPASSGSGGSSAAEEALADLEGKVLSTGPYGEEPTPGAEISLTDDELDEIRGMNATAAIVMHYGGNDWARGQIDGLGFEFERMGIEVISTTDASFRVEKQVSDIETVLVREPDVMVSIPTDPASTAAAYRKVVEQGVKLVFMDNVAADFKPGEDYISVVSADNYGNGVASAHIMAANLGSRGKVGAVYNSADFFVTNQRYEAFEKTLSEDYPRIQLIEEQGVIGPDFAGEALQAASAMLTEHRDMSGIWAVWDVPAEGVIAATRTANRGDLVVTTIDFGEPVAIDIASGGPVKGLGSQRPFDQGVTEARLAGYGLLGKEAPPYVALPALPVMAGNVLDAWQTVYRERAPEKVREVSA